MFCLHTRCQRLLSLWNLCPSHSTRALCCDRVVGRAAGAGECPARAYRRLLYIPLRTFQHGCEIRVLFFFWAFVLAVIGSSPVLDKWYSWKLYIIDVRLLDPNRSWSVRCYVVGPASYQPDAFLNCKKSAEARKRYRDQWTS